VAPGLGKSLGKTCGAHFGAEPRSSSSALIEHIGLLCVARSFLHSVAVMMS